MNSITIFENLNPPQEFVDQPLSIAGVDKSYIQKINDYVDFTLYFTEHSQISRRFGSEISTSTKELFQGMREHCRYFHSEVEDEIYHVVSNLSTYSIMASEVTGEILEKIREDGILKKSLPKEISQLVTDLLLPEAKQNLNHTKQVSDGLTCFYTHCLNDLNQLNVRIDENQRLSSNSRVVQLTSQVDSLKSETERVYALYEEFIKKDRNALTTGLIGTAAGAIFQNPKSMITSATFGAVGSIYFGRHAAASRKDFYQKMKEIETAVENLSQEQMKTADLQRFRAYLIYLKHLLEPAVASVNNLRVLWANVVYDLTDITKNLDKIPSETLIRAKTLLVKTKMQWDAVDKKVNNIRSELIWY